MPETTFEGRLAQVLRAEAARAVRPFDAMEVALAAVGRPRPGIQALGAVRWLAIGLALLGLLVIGSLVGSMLIDRVPSQLRTVYVARSDGLYASTPLSSAPATVIRPGHVIDVDRSPSGGYLAVVIVPDPDVGEVIADILPLAGQTPLSRDARGGLALAAGPDGMPPVVLSIEWAPAPVAGRELLAIGTHDGLVVVDAGGAIVLDERTDAWGGSGDLAWSKPAADGSVVLAWATRGTIRLATISPTAEPRTANLIDLQPLDDQVKKSLRSRTVGNIAITPDGKHVIAVMTSCGWSCAANLWSVDMAGDAILLDDRAATPTWLSIDPTGTLVLATVYRGMAEAPVNGLVQFPVVGGPEIAFQVPELPPPLAATSNLVRAVWLDDGRVLVARIDSTRSEWSGLDPLSMEYWTLERDGSLEPVATGALDVVLP